MRKNQITIKIDRYGEQAIDGKHQTITVYADSNNIYEALTAAYNLAINQIGNPGVGKSVSMEG